MEILQSSEKDDTAEGYAVHACVAAEIILGSGLAQLKVKRHALGQRVVAAGSNVAVRFEVAGGRQIVTIAAESSTQAELELFRCLPSALQQIVDALRVTLVAVRQDADAAAGLYVREQAELAKLEARADFGGGHSETSRIEFRTGWCIEPLGLGA